MSRSPADPVVTGCAGIEQLSPVASNRRDWLDFATRGVAATAALQLLSRDGWRTGTRSDHGLAAAESGREATVQPHFVPRARRVIQISLVGGLSHLDSFDPKPALDRLHGKTLETSERPDVFFGQVGLLRKPDWEFRPRGQSGLPVSDLFPHIAAQADELAVIRSLVADSANHTPALFFANSGFGFNGYPSAGSWLSYGLGSEAESLPAFIVLADARGGPNGGASNWSSGFLPAEHQGVILQGGSQPVRDLFPAGEFSPAREQGVRDFLRQINERHRDQVGEESLLTARIRSYELAARMQTSIPAACDLATETEATQSAYGLDQPTTAEFGRRCLLARRLLERGVRFIQLYSGGPIAGSPRSSWDAHESVLENHSAEAAKIDQPIGALLADLRARGLLEETLVLFTTEFGRTPFTQSAADQVGTGRDHNRYAFSVWMAGGGVRGGTAYGATDEIGWKVAERPASWHDFHATVLHLLGLDHTRLTYYHNGIQRRLTNVHGEVIHELIG